MCLTVHCGVFLCSLDHSVKVNWLLGESGFRVFIQQLIHSKSDNTVKNYVRYFNSYQDFCHLQEVKALPVKSATLAAFLSFKLGTLTSASSVEAYRSGILWVNSLLTDSDSSSGSWDKSIVSYARRALPQTGCRKAPPIDLDSVKKVANFCISSPTMQNRRLGALSVLAFFSCCRINELLALYVQDLFFEERGIQLFKFQNWPISWRSDCIHSN